MIKKTTLYLIPLVISGIFASYYDFIIPRSSLSTIDGLQYMFVAITLSALFIGLTAEDVIGRIKYLLSCKSVN